MTSLQTAAPAATRETRRRRWRNRPAASCPGPTTAWAAGQSEGTRLTRLTRLASAAGATGSSGLAAAEAAGLLLLSDVQERPLVVMVPAVIETDRLVLALAS